MAAMSEPKQFIDTATADANNGHKSGAGSQPAKPKTTGKRKAV
jgi:hypothetical protein